MSKNQMQDRIAEELKKAKKTGVSVFEVGEAIFTTTFVA